MAFAGDESSSRILSDLQQHYEGLSVRRAQIQLQLDGIAQAINAIRAVPAAAARPRGPVARSVSPMARRGPRPEGGSLKEHIRKVLKSSSRPMSVKDIGSGVMRSGYRTTSKNLGNQISMALTQMAKAGDIRKIARGMYGG